MQKPRHRIFKSCPVEALGKDPKNPNTMSPAMRAKLGRAIQAFGMVQPLLVRLLPAFSLDVLPDDLSQMESGVVLFEIIDGHHRLEEAIADGATDVPIVAVECSPEQARLMQLEMNRLHGDLDLSKVAANMAELAQIGVAMEDLTLSAFDQDEIEQLLRTLNSPDPNDEVMSGAAQDDSGDEPTREATFELVLSFASADVLKKVKRALRKAAGGGRKASLENGIIAALAIE